ncbi:MAG: AI-2E family transporter, partial [Duodenibacillus sp.]|nr:AI-2E family transporter [Duodenibacillus sp.]
WGVLAVSSVDNFLKPILISRGSTLPLALVFLGVLGGIMTFGMLGLVLGPILLSASIAMFKNWIKNPVRIKVIARAARASQAEGESAQAKESTHEAGAEQGSESASQTPGETSAEASAKPSEAALAAGDEQRSRT